MYRNVNLVKISEKFKKKFAMFRKLKSYSEKTLDYNCFLL